MHIPDGFISPQTYLPAFATLRFAAETASPLPLAPAAPRWRTR